MSKPLYRFLLVSDMHYTTDITADEMKNIDPTVKPSAAAGDAFGFTQREKVDKITEAVLAEHAASPLDAVLVLGDLSIDDYNYRNLPNYCRRFKEDCMALLPCPSYAIPGNHDSHPNEVWQEIFGYSREFTLKFGNIAFILLDNFNSVPAAGASGSAYTPTNVEFLKKELAALGDAKIFLCAHHVSEEKESEEFKRIVREDDRIIGMFRGHTHLNKIIRSEAFGEKPLIDIGGYAYMGRKIGDRYDFSIFDESWAWGYQTVEVFENKIKIRHVTPAILYRGSNGVFDVPYSTSDECEIEI